MENKLKHLEFIQGLINRLANNSFLIKGWCITLVSAIAVLSAKDSNEVFMLLAFIPILSFWILDSYYLWQERLYRSHYDESRIKSEDQIDFSMTLSSNSRKFNQFYRSLFSFTILAFYIILVVTVVILIKAM